MEAGVRRVEMTRKRKTIWIVGKGHYSDYRVVGCFTSEALADKFSDYIRGEGAEEMPLDPLTEEVRGNYQIYDVRMQRDGTVIDVSPSAPKDKYDLPTPAVFFSLTPTSPLRRIWLMQTDVLARDSQHAIKIANERRTQAIAKGDAPLA